MRELDEIQSEYVGGGFIQAVAVLAFVYYERQNIRDFVGGVLDGANGTNHMAP
jgi:hypothetical protein